MSIQRAPAKIAPGYVALIEALGRPGMTILPEDLTHLSLMEMTIVMDLYTEKAAGFHPEEVAAYKRAAQRWNPIQYRLNTDFDEKRAAEAAYFSTARALQELGIDPLYIVVN